MTRNDDVLERLAPLSGAPSGGFEDLLRLRAKRQRARRIGAYAVVAVIAVAAVVAIAVVRNGPTPLVPADDRTVDLGIFAPVAGRILSGTWAVDPIAADPSSPSRSTQLRMGPEAVLALGWSSDGTELLFLREDPTDDTFPYDRYLYILRADGTETQLTPEPVGHAAISPDGSRVVFAADGEGLYVVDAEGGQPVRIANGEEPTFSPDGTQLAYFVSGRDEWHLWVANADGTDAHEILADEPAVAKSGDDLTWSPAGDRLAMAGSHERQPAIYTFAPDGSDFTLVITGGINPFWSPDGSQIAYMLPYGEPLGEGSPGLAIADADGSNIREFGFGSSGPWHPGTPEPGAGA